MKFKKGKKVLSLVLAALMGAFCYAYKHAYSESKRRNSF